jgi:hydroxymethylbilane synthase
LKPLRIGTRGSALALWQANHLRGELARRVQVESELVVLKTSGDRFAGSSIDQLGAVGVFTKELEDALCAGRIDLAIHSMKDVPTEFCAACQVAVIFEREDPRDALVTRGGEKLQDLPRGARIGTSSLRRASQLRAFRPDFQIIEMRGNVDTRLRKLDAGECEGVVLAHAGLMRLGFAGRISELLSPDIMLSAVGQGALGLEFLEANRDLYPFLDRLIDRNTMLAVTAERAFQARMQGGCRVPLGAWARIEGEALIMDACVLSVDGSQSIRRRRTITGNINSAIAMALGKELGDEIAEKGGTRLLREARGPAAGKGETASENVLAGKRIVITRTPEHSIGLTESLEELGAEVLQLPMVRFVPAKDSAAFDEAIQRVQEFDWILFTSQVAVQFFAARFRELGKSVYEWQKVSQRSPRAAVVGRATSRAAVEAGFKVDFVAQRESGEGLAAEMAPSVRGKTVLLPHSNLGGELFAKALLAAGANVTSVEAYGTLPPERVDPEILDSIRAGGADVILFASPSAFRNFSALLEKSELTELSRRVQFAAIGPTTRKAMEDQEIFVSIEPADPSTQSTVRAIVDRLNALAKPTPARTS